MRFWIPILLVLWLACPALAQDFDPITGELLTGEGLAGQVGTFVTWALTASGVAAWLAAWLKDSGVLKVIMPLINALGGNVGNAKNAEN